MRKELELKLRAMSRKDFLMDFMKEAQSFDLSEDDISKHFYHIDLYIALHVDPAYIYQKENPPVDALSERQMICSQNAIKSLLTKDYEQALHETLDVLSDYNKDSEITFNEYVLIKNIIEIYSQMGQIDIDSNF